MVILAIDQATTSGYSVVTEHGQLLESGVWKTTDKNRSESRGMRYLTFRKLLNDSIRKWKPDLICHERPLLRGEAATEMGNGFKAHILELAEECGVEVTCVNTTELKKWATGKGNAEKVDMMASCSRMTGMTPVDDNEADAILIGLWAAHRFGDFPAPEFPKEDEKEKRRMRKFKIAFGR